MTYRNQGDQSNPSHLLVMSQPLAGISQGVAPFCPYLLQVVPVEDTCQHDTPGWIQRYEMHQKSILGTDRHMIH